MRRLFTLSTVCLTAGCAAAVSQVPAPTDRYRLELTEVERPAVARQRYGPQKIATLTDSGRFKSTFEDSLVAITFAPATDRRSIRGLEFVLANRTDHSLKVVWDEAAIVNAAGRSGRVMHSGMTYASRTAPQPPAVVVRRGYLIEYVVPVDNVTLGTSTYNPIHVADMLPGQKSAYVGKSIQLLLPLEIEGVVNEYTFTFTMRDASAAP